MAPDPSAADPLSSLPLPAEPGPGTVPPTGGARERIRLRFRKDGPLRWLSHHDLLRTFERLLRRTRLPFRQTQGFNPHPRIVFALSLPLGVIGRAEIVDVELDEELDPASVRQRLQEQCPPGLAFLEAYRIQSNAGVHVRGLCYGIAVPMERLAATRERIEAVRAGEPCWVERSKPVQRRLDVRPFLRELRLNDTTGFLEIDLWLLPTGTARPDEVLSVLGLGDLLEAGAVLERLCLDMEEDPLITPAGQP